MYFRLCAHQFLPSGVERILYLDPDIVCINPISDFFHMDMGNHLFVAAEHSQTTKIVRPLNKFRLKTPNAKGYFNTGVLLMNVALMRERVQIDEIFQFIEENKYKLILPDQDILNALYWDLIMPVDEYIYNYDARYYDFARLYPALKYDLDWIKKNTKFIHFCGKDKPWQEDYTGKLKMFYTFYEEMVKNG